MHLRRCDSKMDEKKEPRTSCSASSRHYLKMHPNNSTRGSVSPATGEVCPNRLWGKRMPWFCSYYFIIEASILKLELLFRLEDICMLFVHLRNSAYFMHCHVSFVQMNCSKSTRSPLNFVLFFAKVTLPTTYPERMNLKTGKKQNCSRDLTINDQFGVSRHSTFI